MLYLRTASGDFINAAAIVQLLPQRAGAASADVTGWLAIRSDGEAVALSAYYAAPGRIEKLLDCLPAVEVRAIAEPVGGPALPCPSENCPCA